MKKIIVLLIVLMTSGIFLFAFTDEKPSQKKNKKQTIYKEGDIIFQSSMSGQSRAIQLATHSKYSHVGMLFKDGNKWMVLEAIQPVCITPLDIWIQRGDNDHYVVKRLANADNVLDQETLKEMKDYGQTFLGKNYDIYFEWSDESIYCSELVWKIYQKTTGIELGELQALREFDFSHPIVQSIAAQRYGDNIPKSEMAISPGEMFDCKLLETVVSANDF